MTRLSLSRDGGEAQRRGGGVATVDHGLTAVLKSTYHTAVVILLV